MQRRTVRMCRTPVARLLLSVVICAVPVVSARAIDPDRREKAERMASRAIEWLRAQQDDRTGGWALPPSGPVYPAITGLVVNGMLMEPGQDASDPDIDRALRFILSYAQEDGGIYDQILANYNTSICLSALARARTPEARRVIPGAQAFLRGLQYSEAADTTSPAGTETKVVTRDHPFYGGVGYGNHGRPDNSNLNLMLQALHDSGVPGDDPAFERALVFLARTQMLDSVNDMPYADHSSQGGFIYATSPNAESVDRLVGQSQAGMIDETLENGQQISRLRAYGSMTYAGFKSYIYADLKRDDPRVVAAYEWLRSNYTLEENPGIGTDGMYYYYVTFARAMHAWGEETIDIVVRGSGDERTETRDWANDLIDRLATLQNEDGSFRSVDDRWMENNPVLITAYGLLALQNARGLK
ncbi:MAG: terpene cyclase/mutase family protein [Phycisphaeraceae bacterium]|nr:MAG: terpene cyclase/mutase family protein [Phycisphaeraceae bacterium]